MKTDKLPLRIHIIGCSGSGKTYLARKLSNLYGLPTLDLDDIFWDHQSSAYSTKAGAGVRDEALRLFAAQERWVIEGIYYRWLVPSFERANSILALQTPVAVQQARIIRRFVRRKLGLEQGRQETLAGLWRFLKWNRTEGPGHFSRALELLDQNGLRYSRCRTFEEAMTAVAASEGVRS